MGLTVGDAVLISTDNPTFHGLFGLIRETADWGCHLDIPFYRPKLPPGLATYRASWGEIVPARQTSRPRTPGTAKTVAPSAAVAVAAAPTARRQAKEQGYEGESCSQCGAMKLRRNGACLCCDECGSTTGCS